MGADKADPLKDVLGNVFRDALQQLAAARLRQWKQPRRRPEVERCDLRPMVL